MEKRRKNFTKQGFVEEFLYLKNLIIGFFSNIQPEESETSPHGLQPHYEFLIQFQTESKPKSFK